ncbi:6-aminohexanoate-dimer hydrolase [Nymphon striatum]|nr:6-aminohexanoate-dimer hydrolase [Nymphon striatum]
MRITSTRTPTSTGWAVCWPWAVKWMISLPHWSTLSPLPVNSGNTFLSTRMWSGWWCAGATGRSVADLLGEKVVMPLGLEQTPYYLTDGVGTAFVLGGLNLTTRDYARFGQMYLQNGQWQGKQIVPEDWVMASTTPSAPTQTGEIGYGYQWWIPVGANPGEYMARGIYGQYIYIDTARNVVIATNAADRKFRENGVSSQNVAIFRQIAESL